MIVGQDVLAVLSAATIKGNALTLAGQIDRKLYERTNKVLEAAGGKWNRKARAHVFERDPVEVIDDVILSGEITRPQDFGFFPTPSAIVAKMIEAAELEPGMVALEPSAGHGAIALELGKVVEVHCVELLPENVATLSAKIGELGTKRIAVQRADFLAMKPRRIYDRVVMNPPFAKQADIRHVTHALQFLKPEGRLVAIMSAGVLFRQDALASGFRDLAGRLGASFEELEPGAFKESGTMVRTVLVTITQ